MNKENQSGTSLCRILVVEESQPVLQWIRDAFRDWHTPASLNFAFSLEDAREFVAKSTPDLVIASLHLSDGNGLELLPDAKGDSLYPLVTLVEQDGELGGEEAVRVGACDYVKKSHAEVATLPRIANSALREWQHAAEKNRLLKTIDVIPDLVGAADREGTMLYINSGGRKMLGLKEDETIAGKRVHELFPNWTIDTLMGDHVPSAAPEPSCSQTSRLVHQEGQDFRGAVLAHLSGRGDIQYFSVFASRTQTGDTGETVRPDRQLALRMETIGRLAAGIAHDLNNALVPIVSNCEMAIEDTAQGGETHNRLTDIWCAATRARDLVRQIVSFGSRTGVGRRRVMAERAVRDALVLARAALPSSMQIDQNLRSDCGAVFVDTTQLSQVVLSTCLRAFNVMQEEGVLGVRLDRFAADADHIKLQPGLRVGDYARITITDAGADPESNKAESLLPPVFSRQDTEIDPGLSEARKIIAAHDGNMQYRSHPGGGTIVVIYLPIVEGDEGEDKADWPSAQGDERILLVDDEDTIAESLARLLRRRGYDVTTKHNGLDALETFCADPDRYDLVITDQTTPHMAGEQLVTQLRRIRPDIPIILTTGYNYSIAPATMQSLGIRGFLHKPFDTHQLNDTIRKALNDR
jgi:DNA-binding response OmpR family regulator/signal transduction histidine kinase